MQFPSSARNHFLSIDYETLQTSPDRSAREVGTHCRGCPKLLKHLPYRHVGTIVLLYVAFPITLHLVYGPNASISIVNGCNLARVGPVIHFAFSIEPLSCNRSVAFAINKDLSPVRRFLAASDFSCIRVLVPRIAVQDALNTVPVVHFKVVGPPVWQEPGIDHVVPFLELPSQSSFFWVFVIVMNLTAA